MNIAESQKPKFFDAIGRSWFIFGAVGVIFGLIGLPVLFQIDELKQTLGSQTGMQSIPGFSEVVGRIFGIVAPMTIGNLILSILMVYFSWKFLKRHNWGRIGLSVINGLMLLGVLWMNTVVWQIFRKLSKSLFLQDMIEQGVIPNIPLIFGSILLVLTIVVAAPVIYMAWYFHSAKVKKYFS